MSQHGSDAGGGVVPDAGVGLANVGDPPDFPIHSPLNMVIDIPIKDRFTDVDDVDNFSDLIDTYARSLGGSDAQKKGYKALVLRTKLGGRWQRLLQQLPDANTFDEAIAEIRKTVASPANMYKKVEAFHNIKLYDNESISEFGRKLASLCRSAFPSPPCEILES